tara:strand:- start:90 stop:779 length:690 start_codon:yes stop_codon:yes gene_type:complete
MANKANEELVNEPVLDEVGLAPVPTGEDLAVNVNSTDDINPEDFLLTDDDDDFGEDVKEDDFSFGKPWKNTFYMRHPDSAWNSVKIGLIKMKNSSQPWVVRGSLCGSLKTDGLYYAKVYTLIDVEGDLLFVPYKVASNGETLDTWNQSGHDIMREDWAPTHWFKIISQQKGNTYKARRAVDQDAWPKPEWPEGGRSEFLNLLMDTVKGIAINSKEDDVYKAIKGQKATK